MFLILSALTLTSVYDRQVMHRVGAKFLCRFLVMASKASFNLEIKAERRLALKVGAVIATFAPFSLLYHLKVY